jgi:hypothetical protein
MAFGNASGAGPRRPAHTQILSLAGHALVLEADGLRITFQGA